MNPVNSKQKRVVMGVTEAEVSDFLRAHPDFFERHLAFIDWREQVFYTIDAVIFAKFEVGIVSPNTFHF